MTGLVESTPEKAAFLNLSRYYDSLPFPVGSNERERYLADGTIIHVERKNFCSELSLAANVSLDAQRVFFEIEENGLINYGLGDKDTGFQLVKGLNPTDNLRLVYQGKNPYATDEERYSWASKYLVRWLRIIDRDGRFQPSPVDIQLKFGGHTVRQFERFMMGINPSFRINQW